MRKELARYCGLILLALVLISVNAEANQRVEGKGTILLKDGVVYEDVQYRVIYRTMVVQIKYKSSKKNISFSDIVQIVDRKGNDITERLLKNRFPAQSPADGDQKSELESQALPPKYWSFGFCLSGNLFFPLGDYYTGFEPGPGFDAEFLLPIDRKFAFRGVVSYSGTRAHEDLAVFAGEDYGSGYLFYDYELTSMIYLACLQWYPHPEPLEAGKVRFSFHVGVGAITHRMEATQVSVSWDGTTSAPEQISVKETKFALRPLGMQVTYMVGSNLGFHGGIAMTIVHVEQSRAMQSEVKLGVTLFGK